MTAFCHIVEFLGLLAIGCLVLGAAGMIIEAWRGE